MKPLQQHMAGQLDVDRQCMCSKVSCLKGDIKHDSSDQASNQWNFGMDTYNFYFIEIRLIVGEGVLKFFPTLQGVPEKKSRFTKGGTWKKKKNLLISHPSPPPLPQIMNGPLIECLQLCRYPFGGCISCNWMPIGANEHIFALLSDF